MERIRIKRRAGRYILAQVNSLIFQSTILIAIFPNGKVDNKFLRRISGIKDLQYEDSYECLGCVFSNSDKNLELIVFQENKDGSIDLQVLVHEVSHACLNLFERIHQNIDATPGQDEVFANTMGVLSNMVYSVMKKNGIPLSLY